MLWADGKYSVDGLFVNIIEERSILRSGVEIPFAVVGGDAAAFVVEDNRSSRAAMRLALALSCAQ